MKIKRWKNAEAPVQNLSGMSSRSHRTRPAMIGILVAALSISGMSLAAASTAIPPSTTSNKAHLSSSQLAEIKAILNAHTKPVQFQRPGPVISAKKARGKIVYFLTNSTELPFTQLFLRGLKEAAQVAGVTIKVGDAQSQTSEMGRLMQEAINIRASAVIVFGSQSESIAGAMQAAKAAHIPTILTFQGDPGLPPASQRAQWGAFADVTFCYSCAAALVGDYAIAALHGNVHARMTWESDMPGTVALKRGFASALNKYCPKTCSTTYVGTTNSTAYQDTVAGTQAALLKPETNFIFPEYDGWAAAVLPAITAANAQNRVTVGSDNADLAQMQQMASGTPIKVDVGSPVEWSGWAAMDETLRAIVHAAPVANENLPIRVFDTANISKFNLAADPSTWFGATNYRSDYERLWGLKK